MLGIMSEFSLFSFLIIKPYHNSYLKMKSHHYQPKPQQKPIKYKQFIQQLQNSSRSSLQDHSLLSQRSFRQSNTARDFHDHLKNEQSSKSLEKQKPQIFKLKDPQSSSKLSNPSSNQNELKRSDPNDKLYTFCDAKLTERSIQIVNNSNSKRQAERPVTHRDGTNLKYFKTNKQRTQQKQNMDFVNQILQKIQSGGFEGKVLKTQKSQPQNLQRSIKKSPQPITMMKKQNQGEKQFVNSGQNFMNQSNSSRKIQSVKKIFVLSRQASNRVSNKKINCSNMSEQKSRENSLRKTDTKAEIQKQSQQKCSSKKKVVSLNINPLKVGVGNQNNVRVKLSLDKSLERQNQERQKVGSINLERQINLSSRGSLVEGKILSRSIEKMSELEQQKIQNTNMLHKDKLVMSSGPQFSQLRNVFPKDNKSTKQSQILQLQKIIQQYQQKQKKLSKQIYQLNQRLKKQCSSTPNNPNKQQNRQIQILQKDSIRLRNSYKQMKRMYEMVNRQKQQIESELDSVKGQNRDLKQCLEYKQQQLRERDRKIKQMSVHIQQLSNEIQNRVYPSQLQGLSHMIRDKLSQYEQQIQWLQQQNKKLRLLRQKLEKYNSTLKEQIDQKDVHIEGLERGLKEMRKSKREDNGEFSYRGGSGQGYQMMRLVKMCKELESKLKLANIHNQYLTQQIVSLKHHKNNHFIPLTQDEQKQSYQTTSTSNHLPIDHYQHAVQPKYNSNKSTTINTLANTITTRNSSISHTKDHLFDHFINKLNNGSKHHDDHLLFVKQNCLTEEHPQP